MKTVSVVLIGAGAVALVAGGVAFAQGKMGHGFGDGYGPGRGMMMERMFSRLDQDNDGAVSVDEALRMPGTRFADVDTNKDGFVEKAEVEAAIRKRFEERAERMIKRFDVDGDGKVSKEEAEKPFRKRFAVFDKNDDGKVTKDEARDAMPMMGGRGEGWGRGHGWGHHGGGHHGWGRDGWGPDRL